VSIGFGILSWRGYESLAAALETYRSADLFEIFDRHLSNRNAATTVQFQWPFSVAFRLWMGQAGSPHCGCLYFQAVAGERLTGLRSVNAPNL
jgi:hypothetical protein